MIQREPIEAISPRYAVLSPQSALSKRQAHFAPDARNEQLLIEAGTLEMPQGAPHIKAPRNRRRLHLSRKPRAAGPLRLRKTKTHHSWSEGTVDLVCASVVLFQPGGVTPAMANLRVGAGLKHAFASSGCRQDPFDGQTYRLRLPPNVPVNDFWALTLYDTQTTLDVAEPPTFPTVGSQDEGQCKKMQTASFDI